MSPHLASDRTDNTFVGHMCCSCYEKHRVKRSSHYACQSRVRDEKKPTHIPTYTLLVGSAGWCSIYQRNGNNLAFRPMYLELTLHTLKLGLVLTKIKIENPTHGTKSLICSQPWEILSRPEYRWVCRYARFSSYRTNVSCQDFVYFHTKRVVECGV